MPKFAAIVVAAGSGSRFGGEENKIFAVLDGQPLFIRALQLFVNREDVCQTILAVSPSDMGHLKTKFAANLAFMDVKLVEGGAERVDTVSKALAAVVDDAEFVAVHDAVRPCVTSDWIDAVFAAAAKSGAAILAAPITSTLKRVGAAKIVEATVSRDGLYVAQTPQVFRTKLLKDAYAHRDRVEPPITDDAQLVEALGHPITVVDGDPRNIKVTTKGDLPLAAALLKSLPQPKPKSSTMGAFDEAKW